VHKVLGRRRRPQILLALQLALRRVHQLHERPRQPEDPRGSVSDPMARTSIPALAHAPTLNRRESPAGVGADGPAIPTLTPTRKVVCNEIELKLGQHAARSWPIDSVVVPNHRKDRFYCVTGSEVLRKARVASRSQISACAHVNV
jgi:hypothetical protein